MLPVTVGLTVTSSAVADRTTCTMVPASAPMPAVTAIAMAPQTIHPDRGRAPRRTAQSCPEVAEQPQHDEGHEDDGAEPRPCRDERNGAQGRASDCEEYNGWNGTLSLLRIISRQPQGLLRLPGQFWS
jgi:hypothetical protein